MAKYEIQKMEFFKDRSNASRSHWEMVAYTPHGHRMAIEDARAATAKDLQGVVDFNFEKALVREGGLESTAGNCFRILHEPDWKKKCWKITLHFKDYWHGLLP